MSPDVEHMIGDYDRPCWNDWLGVHENQQMEEFWCEGDEDLKAEADGDEPDYSHDLDIQFDLHKDRFVVGYHVFNENEYKAVVGEPWVTSVWWLLGHSPSAVALPPRSRRPARPRA